MIILRDITFFFTFKYKDKLIQYYCIDFNLTSTKSTTTL